MTVFLHKHTNADTCSSQEDNGLIETLTNVFKERFPYSKRLTVAGILSYTTDDGSEKFLKIDFSSSDPPSLAMDSIHLSSSTDPTEIMPVVSPESDKHSSSTANCLSDYSTAGSVSPPLLPPLVICPPKSSRALAPESPLMDDENPNDPAGRLQEDSSEHCRRDRRKLRRPKRQIVNALVVGTKQDEDLEHGLEASPSNKKGKYTDSDSGITPDFSEVKELGQNVAQSVMMCEGAVSPPPSLVSHTEAEKPASDTAPVCSSSSAIQPPFSQSKLTINGKSISISELGDFCNLLPVNALLGRPTVATKEGIGGAEKGTVSGAHSVMLTNSNATSHTGTNTLLTGNNSLATQISGQSVLLNPNLAAALAAALSGGTNNSQVTAAFENNHPSCISNINTPSIALTGPSGEILGTIPIASATNAQATIAQPNAIAPQNANFNSGINSTAVSLPTNQGLNPSSLMNTLNWLKYATAPTDANQQMISPTLVTNPAGGSTTSLFQSLTQQSQTAQSFPATSVSKPQPMASISIGPTLALIGTLGLNQSSLSAGTLTSHSTDTTCSVTPAAAVSYSTPHPGNYGSSSTNNAALVAAAILRGLSSVKHPQCDAVETCNSDPNAITSQGSLTLITNNLCSATSSRPGIISADVPLGSIANLFSPKGLTGNLSTGTTTLTPEQSNSLIATMLNRGSISVGNVNSATSRGSIMFSYPRGSGEMNVVLAPASSHSFNSPMTSVATLPAGLSLQNLSTAQPSALTLGSPVLLHTSVTTSSTLQTTTVVSATSAAPSVVSSLQRDVGVPVEKCIPISQSSGDVRHQSNVTDPTTSAIDRILQTIKGCMNNSTGGARNADTKLKIQPKKNESNNANIKSENASDQASNLSSESRTLSVKLTPITFCINKSTEGTATDLESVKQPEDSSKRQLLSNGRLCTGASTTDGMITKVYRCRYCGKTFNRKFCRERHERLHTGVKPYNCEICDEKFIRLEDKKRHVRSLQHYLTGRAAYMNSDIPLLPRDEIPDQNTDCSNCLPMLGRTLQTEAQEGIDEAFNELEAQTGLDTSESTSNDHGSECGSFDVEESPEKNDYGLPGSYNHTGLEYASEVPDMKSSLTKADETLHEEGLDNSPAANILSGVVLSVTKPTNRCRVVLRETQSEINSANSPSQDSSTKSTTTGVHNGESLCSPKVGSS
ncbi:zinc finger protein YGR067C [Clonorchis sinensis]|uniref:Zinc finger protein YGR067C n=1 Tax=Clonorchis sinensis TaxID=79923 RepID=H2KUG2_CLOSI|nr:zinc finger protein YGR067C [Clonorchis sinensis]